MEDILVSDEFKLEASIQRLNQHMKNKKFFKPYAFHMFNESTIEEDFSGRNMRQSYYTKCEFINCNFFEAGFLGSSFRKCIFTDCNFNYADFQSCAFQNCKFVFSTEDAHNMEAARFGKSIFQECVISDVLLHYVDFSACVIEGGIFSNLKCKSIRIEDAIIKKAKFSTIRFSAQNFDFLLIEDIYTHDIVVPFPAIPSIYNGIQYLQTTSDDIQITSYGKNGFERISKDEYLALIPDFEIYYIATQNFFPLSNIYLAKGHTEKALEALISGIIQSVKLRNFRMVKHYCQAVRYSKLFSAHEKHMLFNKISMAIAQSNLTSIEQQDMQLYWGGIKEDLLNEHSNPHIDITLSTTIESNDYEKIAVFIQGIENIIALYVGKNETHHIEIRHDSPVSFFIQLVAEPERLVVFVAAVFDIYLGTIEITRALKKEIKKHKKLKQEKSSESKAYEKRPTAPESTASPFTLGPEVATKNGNIYISNASYCIFNCNVIDSSLQSAYVNNTKAPDSQTK